MSCYTALPLHPSTCWRQRHFRLQQQQEQLLAGSCHLLSSSSSFSFSLSSSSYSLRICRREIGKIPPRFCSPATFAPRSSSSGGQDGPESPPPASRSPGVSKKGFGRSSSSNSSGGGPKKKEKGATDGKKKGRGFGGNGPEQRSGVLVDQGANSSSSEKKNVLPSRLEKVVDAVDKKSSAGISSSSSIDPSQAKLGKVDFVRVQNWGSEEGEEAPKLEDLRVKSFSPAATSTSASNESSNSTGPFYEELVKRLQLLESKGEIAVAQAKPLPSFDRWVFGEERYLQFLVDQLSVFEALREAVAAIRNEWCRSVAEGLEEVVPLGGAASGVGLFGVELGLDRCEALSADITAVANSSHIEKGVRPESSTATTQAAGYAKYISQLGKASVGDGDKPKEACLKLISHIFAVYVSHLTTGMRIGAKALDNVVSLRQTKALSFYRDYPQQVKEPLKLFVATINAAGAQITSEDDHEQVMDELPKAFQKTSLLLSVLAVEEPLLVESS